MNLAMEQTEEYVNGQLKKKYGDCFIRGNNGTSGGRSLRGNRPCMMSSLSALQLCTSRL